jgi:hypothetical protein
VSAPVTIREFVWRGLEVLTDHLNETPFGDPPEPVSVSVVIEAIIIAAVPLDTLRKIAEVRPELLPVIAEWERFKRPGGVN